MPPGARGGPPAIRRPGTKAPAPPPWRPRAYQAPLRRIGRPDKHRPFQSTADSRPRCDLRGGAMSIDYLPWNRPVMLADRVCMRDTQVDLTYAEVARRVDAVAEQFASA